jgi:hypothetical protein
VSQKIADRAHAAEARIQETRGFMQQVRLAARRRYTPEEKVRIECWRAFAGRWQ